MYRMSAQAKTSNIYPLPEFLNSASPPSSYYSPIWQKLCFNLGKENESLRSADVITFCVLVQDVRPPAAVSVWMNARLRREKTVLYFTNGCF